MSDTEPAPRTAPRQLWLIAQTFLGVLHMLFGAPEDVAARHTLTRAAHTLMASWLRVGEALMRRLLLIEAAALPPSAPRTPRTRAHTRTRQAMSFAADAPETWRACFACMDRRRPAGMRRSRLAGRRRSMRLASAWPLAERYEALIRVFNQPAPYAHRLARTLHAAPQRRGCVLRAPPEAEHRIEDYWALDRAAEDAARRFMDSS
ncbi:MAG: hypothetical protein R3C16_03985 [Hyphomonadaceae bacterium]